MADLDLTFLESVANLKPLLQVLTGRKPSTALTREICVCLQQGRFFYESAANSALEIRPLLLFYGTMALARAVVAARRMSRLQHMAHSHGLRDRSPAGARLADLQAHIQQTGTFQELNDVVAPLNAISLYVNFMPQRLMLPGASSAQLNGMSVSSQRCAR